MLCLQFNTHYHFPLGVVRAREGWVGRGAGALPHDALPNH
jgi:hypothetical protein